VKRRFARQNKQSVAEQQALSGQIADGASERDTADQAAGIGKHQVRQDRERQQDRVFAQD
jgi:hypothetical protein